MSDIMKREDIGCFLKAKIDFQNSYEAMYSAAKEFGRYNK